jgi:tetratricopeptide (TPR) repeat protein
MTRVPVDEVVAAARALATAGRWGRAASLLDAAAADDPGTRARIALAAAQVALEADWFAGTSEAAQRLSAAEAACATADLDLATRWDLAFARLRQQYAEQVLRPGGFTSEPAGTDRDAAADLRRRAGELCEQAPDGVRRGWAEFYLGVVVDNVVGDRAAAPAHYEAALRAGESGDDLLAREALRHLGDHDHDNGNHTLALERWRRATALGARAGAVQGTLSQQMLLAVLARDAGDESGAVALAREVARWAGALGAVRIEAQATGFVAGTR